MTTKALLKTSLHRLGLFRVTARLAHRILHTPRARRRDELRTLYRSLITPGDLVFDVGANDGTYAEAFASLGARVVAIEPNPACVAEIRMRCPSSVTIAETAVGALDGVATMKMSSDPGYSGLSSLSASWLTTAQQAPRFREMVWDREITVPVTTLDALQERYGAPAYIKIDVEGYEEEALNGLSRQPPLLSVEYNTEALVALLRCLNHRVIAPASRFNYVAGFGTALALSAWVSAETFHGHVVNLPPQSFGDVFIRR